MNQIEWKEPAVPRHVIQMLPYDRSGKFLMMHRSNNVRSARNVWSIPTGEHEIGERIFECASRELWEEYGLIINQLRFLTQYENIAGDEAPPHYHWVLSIYGAEVDDVTQAVNKEPDKHDQMIFPTIEEVSHPNFFDNHRFHNSLHYIISLQFPHWLDLLNVQNHIEIRNRNRIIDTSI